MVPIDGIPVEILHQIFTIHVWEHHDTPHRLLRVSRRWYAVTDNTPSLWGDIALYEAAPTVGLSGFSIEQKHPVLGNKILCRSLGSLAAAIKRTRRSMFELTIIIKWESDLPNDEWKLLKRSWFAQRCRSLRIEAGNPSRLSRRISDLFALERLKLVTSNHPDDAIYSPLLKMVQRSSRRLWSLSLNIRPSYDQVVKELFSRVTELSVDGVAVQLDEAAKAATLVKTLDLTGPMFGWEMQPITCPSPDLDTVILRSLSWSFLTQETASKIRHLKLYTKDEKGAIPESPEFPKLTHLTVHDWWGRIEFNAPRLEVLRLCQSGMYDGMFERMKGTTLRPTKLELEMTMPEREADDRSRICSRT